MNPTQKLCFIDLETTGISPLRDRVIEVGIAVKTGDQLEKYTTFINPEVRLPPEITSITGITSQDIENAPTFSQIIDTVEELTDGAIFIAHNARFDYAFLKHEFARLGKSFSRKTLCTVRLSRALFPGQARYNLDAVTSFLGLSIQDRHRALPDALALIDIFEVAAKHELFEETILKLLKKPTLPIQLSEEILDTLPDSVGIYTFVDPEGTILYVGKSVNIRTRVKSHFMSDYARSTDLAMSRQVHNVYADITAGEIGALIRESRMIKEVSPVYNRALRRSRQMIVALFSRKDGIPAIALSSLADVPIDQIDQILACFGSKKKAQDALRVLAKEYQLCPKYLTLEKGPGRCFASQIGQCTGVCDGHEDLSYHERFTEGFSKLRVAPWPFSEAAVITEESEQLKEMHMMYKWCYLGSVVEDKRTGELVLNKAEQKFDWDEYKILRRAITKLRKKKKGITPISLSELQQSFHL